MKKAGILLLFIFCMLNFSGCATPKTNIAQQHLDEAAADIKHAKELGATSETSTHFKQALRYFRAAEMNMQREPLGGLTAYLNKRKLYEKKASENALLARQEAALAVKDAWPVKKDLAKREIPDLDLRVQSLHEEVQQLKSHFIILQQEFASLKAQSQRAGQGSQTFQSSVTTDKDEEEYSAKTAPKAQATYGDKEVSNIQFKFLSNREEQVIFKLSSPFAPKTFFVGGRKPRFVCDFFGAKPGVKIPYRINVGGELIKRIRTWHHTGQNSKLRVVLDLTHPLKHKARQKLIKDQNIYIVIMKPN